VVLDPGSAVAGIKALRDKSEAGGSAEIVAAGDENLEGRSRLVNETLGREQITSTTPDVGVMVPLDVAVPSGTSILPHSVSGGGGALAAQGGITVATDDKGLGDKIVKGALIVGAAVSL